MLDRIDIHVEVQSIKYEKFEEILNLLNRLEDEIIYKTIEDRPFKEGDPTYTLDDAKNKLKQRKK